jgi:putative glutamine amidotransferase
MTAPLIGVTTRRISSHALGAVPAGVVDAPLWGVFAEYCESVSAAGGLPVMIARSSDPVAVVERLDALVLSGGEDVAPHRYGARDDEHSGTHDEERDEFEIQIARAAVMAGIPVLAICRGAQVLNVALGGTLESHVTDSLVDHATTQEHRSVRRHEIRIEADSVLAGVLGADAKSTGVAEVNSYHHQAVLTPGAGVRIVAWAQDDTVEAFEIPGQPVIAVQWHPEMHAGTDPLFHWLVTTTLERKRTS